MNQQPAPNPTPANGLAETLSRWSSPMGTLAIIVAVVMWAHSLYRDTQQLRIDSAVTSQRITTIETEQAAQGKSIANMLGKLELLIDRHDKKK